MVSVKFLAVGVNTFPNYDSHYHDCHDNFNIFCKDNFNKKTFVCETRNFSQCTEDVTFVLAEKTRNPVCSYVFIQTEHPKLLIFETRPGNSFLENKHLEVQNMDIFTYVNSKFIYSKTSFIGALIYRDLHLSGSRNLIYRDILFFLQPPLLVHSDIVCRCFICRSFIMSIFSHTFVLYTIYLRYHYLMSTYNKSHGNPP